MEQPKRFGTLYTKSTTILICVVVSVIASAGGGIWRLHDLWIEASREVEKNTTVSEAAREAFLTGVSGLTAAEQALSISDPKKQSVFEQHVTEFQETSIAFRLLVKALAWGHNSEAFKRDSEGSTYREWVRRGWKQRFKLGEVSYHIRELAGVAEIYWSGYVKHAEQAFTSQRNYLTALAANDVDRAKQEERSARAALYGAIRFQRLTADSLAQLMGAVNEQTKASTKQRESTGDFLFSVLVFSVPGLVLLPTFIGWFMVTRGVLRPLGKLTETVASIGQREDCKVLYLERCDELGDLARSIDRMQQDLQITTVSKDYFDNVIKSIQDCLFVLTPNLTIRMVNPAGRKLLGYKEKELIGAPYSTVFVDADALYKKEEYYDFGKTGVLADTRTRLLTKDGREVVVWLKGSALIGESGDPEAIVCVAHDMSERDRLESQLIQAQKLESVGQLAAGIAHEINTPIQYVRDNTLFLQTQFENLLKLNDLYRKCVDTAQHVPADHLEEVEQASKAIRLKFLLEQIPLAIKQTLEGAESVVSIVRSMKDFSHPGSKEKTMVDVNKAIQSTVTVSRNEWKYVAEIELDLDESLPTINGYIGELNQVFLNLIVNAAHAISDATNGGKDGRGVITVSSKCSDDRIEVQIRDTGTGIPEEARPHIFNPFFTTKDVGKGTGQGLAIAYNTVVEKHQGTLEFETELDRGTTFVIGFDASV